MGINIEILQLIIAGGLGALVKDILLDNAIVLPKTIDGVFVLGGLGGLVIGAAVGYLVDNNPTTAFFAGYAGSQMLLALAEKSGVE
jgi:hypothetical protein